MISSGISNASFGMSFSLRASHFGTWNVYVSVSHPEICFGIGISRARGTNSGSAIVTFLHLVKVCASRNALVTVDGNKKHKFNRNCRLPSTLLTLPPFRGDQDLYSSLPHSRFVSRHATLLRSVASRDTERL